MKIVRFSIGRKSGYGVLEDRDIRVIQGNPFRGIRYAGVSMRLDDIRLLAPCVPSKIVCLGLNYRSHAAEAKQAVPKSPLLFLKPPTAVIGPEDKIVYPAMSQRVDYEGELGVVMKKRASHITEAEALNYVLGYTCFNDVTARDLQNRDGQ